MCPFWQLHQASRCLDCKQRWRCRWGEGGERIAGCAVNTHCPGSPVSVLVRSSFPLRLDVNGGKMCSYEECFFVKKKCWSPLSSPETHTSKFLSFIPFTWWLGWGSEFILSRRYLERLILNSSCTQGSGNLVLLSIELLIYSKEMKMFISVISCTRGHHRLHLYWPYLLVLITGICIVAITGMFSSNSLFFQYFFVIRCRIFACTLWFIHIYQVSILKSAITKLD